MATPSHGSISAQIRAVFSRSRYKRLPELKIDEWEELVSRRHELIERQAAAERGGKIDSSLQNDIIRLLEQPLPDPLTARNQRVTESDRTAMLIGYQTISTMTMFSLLDKAHDKERFGKAIRAYNRYQRQKRVKAEEIQLLRLPVTLASDNPHRTMHPFSIEVEIEMDAPDAIIKADFARWLKRTREDLGIKEDKIGRIKHANTIMTKDLALIIDAGAVQFIDLELWARAFGKELADSDYDWAIFEHESPTTRIRDTTKKWAAFLLKKRTLEVLMGQNRARFDYVDHHEA